MTASPAVTPAGELVTDESGGEGLSVVVVDAGDDTRGRAVDPEPPESPFVTDHRE